MDKIIKVENMSKYVYLLDPGHGGIVNGEYVTSGKRSPKFPDGVQLFEGVYNREVVANLKLLLDHHKIEYIDVVNSQTDVSLGVRVKKANEIHMQGYKPCVYISFHGDAAGDGIQWHQASGISVFTSKGQTKSDVFAALVIDSLEEKFGNSTKWRKDTTDGDEDKEENFYVLRETLMSAILIESGFMTNKEECTKMMGDEWKEMVAEAVCDAILKWEKL